MFDSLLYEALPKTALYMAALVAIGVAVARALLAYAGGHVPTARVADLDARFHRLGRTAACFALAMLIARAWAYTAAAFGPADAFEWENLRLIALESRWGAAWRWQVAAAAALVIVSVVSTGGRGGWFAYLVSAFAFGSSLPLLGHAAGSMRSLIVHAAHIVTAGAWIGTLAAIGWGVLPVVHTPHSGGRVLESMVARFAAIALPAAATVGISGLVLTALYVGSPRSLIDTAYGQALLFKVALVAGIVVCGRANHLRARRGASVSRSQIGVELAFAAAAIAATSVLTQLEQP